MVGAVESVLQIPIPEGRVTHKLSSRGKYVSVNIGPVTVVSSDQVTGEPLIQWKDDTAEVLKSRLEAFHRQTEPKNGEDDSLDDPDYVVTNVPEKDIADHDANGSDENDDEYAFGIDKDYEDDDDDDHDNVDDDDDGSH